VSIVSERFAVLPGVLAVFLVLALTDRVAGKTEQSPLLQHPSADRSRDEIHQEQAQDEPRQQQIEREIGKLGSEVESLSASERGVLGELNRLDALSHLRQLERAAIDRQALGLEERLAAAQRRLDELTARRSWASARLRSRLRELYRQGALHPYQLMLSAREPASMLRAFRLAAAVASSDAALVFEVRESQRELERGREELLARQKSLLAARRASERAGAEIETARAEKHRLLASIRKDRQVRSGALEELRRASVALSRLAEGLSGGARGGLPGPGGIDPRAQRPDASGLPLMDFARFQGLLSWPCAGRVSAGFGPTLNPRFRTVVPHDGIDIDAPYGEDIRAIFDGKVAFAGWLSGYGLTLLLEHGGGFMSVCAHASALLVEAGEKVRRGQLVAKVGDTGSLKGPQLYFEIRKDGRPMDPLIWLKTR